jgi:hypothetical protein
LISTWIPIPYHNYVLLLSSEERIQSTALCVDVVHKQQTHTGQN